MSLKQTIQSDMKDAMRAKNKERVSTLRMLIASIQKREIDERVESLDDAAVLAAIEKQVKQHKDSAKQYADNGRDDRAAAELSEASILQTYLPEPLSDEELDALLEEVVSATGAEGMKDMGKVMAAMKEKAQGRADMGALSGKVKARLAG